MDLPLIWILLIHLALLIYVCLDGFDLGIGILFLTGRGNEERDTMMNTVAPVWDGNETWRILGGGGLFAAFPLAYSVLLTAFYAPVIVMLLALILRGVAFEFRFRTERGKKYWDWAFFGGSVTAALCQGIMVGAFVQGVAMTDGIYSGGWYDWLTPFSLLAGVALVIGYALLGASWLVIKTEGEIQARMRRRQLPLMAAALLAILLVSFGTVLENERIRERWFAAGSTLFLWVIPAASLLLAGGFYRTVRAGREILPFLLALALFLSAFSGMSVSLFPLLIPPEVTYVDAANDHGSLRFMLYGAVILLPIILSYTAYNYWIFRGKVKPGEGYH